MTKSIAARLSQVRNTKTIEHAVTETNAHTATLRDNSKQQLEGGKTTTTTTKNNLQHKTRPRQLAVISILFLAFPTHDGCMTFCNPHVNETTGSRTVDALFTRHSHKHGASKGHGKSIQPRDSSLALSQAGSVHRPAYVICVLGKAIMRSALPKMFPRFLFCFLVVVVAVVFLSRLV